MPIYEYQCGRCGGRKEVLHRAGAKKQPRCPGCGGRMKRVISPTAFILKGSGWYVTDYPSKSRTEGMKSEKKAGEKKDTADKKKDAPQKKTPPPGQGKKSKTVSSRRR